MPRHARWVAAIGTAIDHAVAEALQALSELGFSKDRDGCGEIGIGSWPMTDVCAYASHVDRDHVSADNPARLPVGNRSGGQRVHPVLHLPREKSSAV